MNWLHLQHSVVSYLLKVRVKLLVMVTVEFEMRILWNEAKQKRGVHLEMKDTHFQSDTNNIQTLAYEKELENYADSIICLLKYSAYSLDTMIGIM